MKEGLKQRVIGALVLIGIAIIFLPSFFRERQPYQVDMTSQIPARPDIIPVIIEDPVRPLGIDPAPDPATMFIPESDQPVQEAVETREVVATDAAEAIDSIDVTQDVLSDSEASSPESAAVDATNDIADTEVLPEAGADAWVIQVASLRKAESAQNLKDDLQARGYKAYVREVETPSGLVSRVFIGPKLDKQAALTIKAKVDLIFKVNSLVLAFKS